MSKSRVYIHIECNEETVVTMPHVRVMCNPVQGFTSTYCSSCGDYFPISGFKWKRSDELISTYYERYKEMLPPYVFFFNSNWLTLAILCLGIGLIGGGSYYALVNAIGTLWAVISGLTIGLFATLLILSFWSDFVNKLVASALNVKCVMDLD